MKKAVLKMIAVLTFGASITMSGTALADEWPFVPGDYWEVTGIDIQDGGSYKYSKWLAEEWRKDLEFAKSKGWIKDYKVLANNYPRKGEPDLYLIRIMDRIATGPEGEERAKEWVKHMEKSMAKMQEESGNRAEYREVMSSSLLQEMPLSDFSDDLQPQPEQVISFALPDGEETMGVVREVGQQHATVDFNHPLAGHAVVFRVRESAGFCFDTDAYQVTLREVTWKGEEGTMVFSTRGDPAAGNAARARFFPSTDPDRPILLPEVTILQGVEGDVVILSIPLQYFGFWDDVDDAQAVFDAQLRVDALVNAERTANDLVCRLPCNLVHRQQECFACARVGQVDRNNHSNTNTNTEQGQHELPRVPQHVAEARSIADPDHVSTSLPSSTTTISAPGMSPSRPSRVRLLRS